MDKKFEVHITGVSKEINTEFDILGIKNICVDLLRPDMDLLRTEYMSSYVVTAVDYEACFSMVQDVCKSLKTEIVRVKIECPLYPEYYERSIYMESHFKVEKPEEYIGSYPLSRNQRSGKIMGTDRTHDHRQYEQFAQKWMHVERELCLFDDYVREDADWFRLYNKLH